jgi:2,3-bisphosphoglycerate-independent phosphoglycerate mutase
MTEYQHGWPYPVAFRSAHAADTLGAVLARAGASQLHVAETEKYAHVTYFFNGGEEELLPGAGVVDPLCRDAQVIADTSRPA